MKIAALAGVALVCACSAAVAQDVTQPASQVQTHVRAPSASGQSAFQMGAGKCNGPIDVASDNFVGNFNTKVGTYLGNVIVTQATCKLRADQVKAEAIGGNDLNRLTATGHVVFDSTSGTATGDNGVYDLGPRTVTLTGSKVVLVKGKDVMRGTMLVVDMNTGLAHLTAKGMPGGRVHSIFIPKPRASDEGGPKTSSGTAPKTNETEDK